eukprot:3603038-Alexandrium_andersonii.AAC.1
MVFCVIDQCLMARRPRAHTPPQVDRRVASTPQSPCSLKRGRGPQRPATGSDRRTAGAQTDIAST